MGLAGGMLVGATLTLAAAGLDRRLLAAPRDLAPTVLHLVGLPVSRELAGAVLETALTPEFRRSHAVRRVASYGRRPGQGRSESVFDREMLQQLRSLGYLQ